MKNEPTLIRPTKPLIEFSTINTDATAEACFALPQRVKIINKASLAWLTVTCQCVKSDPRVRKQPLIG